MKTTREISNWLDNVLFTNREEIFELYKTLETETSTPSFKCFSENGCLFIKHVFGDSFITVSSKESKEYFISILSDRYFNGERIASWFECNELLCCVL